jgi:hypothetical protein
LVGFPEHLEIKHSQWPIVHLDRIREEIVESVQGAISSIGLGKGVLGVRRWADQSDIAESLHERYGPALVLTVGHFPYPDIGSGNNRYLDVGREQPDWASLPDEIFLSLEENIEIRSGSHVNSQLMIRNESTMEIVALKLMPPIVDLASSRVVGGYEGAIAMEQRRSQVPAGASKEVPILIGTASTRTDLGYAVPPGLWAIGDGGFQRNVPIEILP